jgi:deazaflavin-dependent oxidoreductase (nitroreductase family)
MPLSRRLARFNRRFTNRLTRQVAGWAPGFAIVIHSGRRSGREFETPVNVFRSGDFYVFALTYGESEWVKNVLAAGTCRIRTRRRELTLVDPVRRKDPTRRLATIPARWILRLIKVEDFLLLREARPDLAQST